MTGMNRYDDKRRREVRRRNHIKKDHEKVQTKRGRNRESRYIPEPEEFDE